jgi:hypothetical protein
VTDNAAILTQIRNRDGGGRTVSGKYRATSPVITLPTSAQSGGSTGIIWLSNPIGSTKLLAVRHLSVDVQFAALAVDLVPGELRFNRFTYTGTPSGTPIVIAQRDSTDAAVTGRAWSSGAGWTVTQIATLWGAQLPTMDLVTGGAGHWNPYRAEWVAGEVSDQVVLRAGEGVVLWNAMALTTANRRAVASVAWEEYT